LRECSGVRLLATSREPLGIAGEVLYRLPTLAVPAASAKLTAETALGYGAIALFVERARAAKRSFTLTDENAGQVAAICRQLDGIALAIELAAPRLAVLTLAQLDERLNERFRVLTRGNRASLTRHQTMRALIGWSYDLLSKPERTVFRRISAFAGGWTLEAASEVCASDDIDRWDVLDILSALVAKSLVVVDLAGSENRYRLLESLREYAREKLADSGEGEAVLRRHATYYRDFAERAEAVYWTTPARSWLTSMETRMVARRRRRYHDRRGTGRVAGTLLRRFGAQRKHALGGTRARAGYRRRQRAGNRSTSQSRSRAHGHLASGTDRAARIAGPRSLSRGRRQGENC
jgi:predicted ATPase